MTQNVSISSEPRIWTCRELDLDYTASTLVMGILNVTPDSFSDGGCFYTPEQAVMQAVQLEKDGADIIDVGAESTRPGSEPLSADEELSRLIPALKLISERVKVPLSIDTYKSKTAEQALSFGAAIINDVWGLQKDPDMASVVASYGAGVVIMANYTDEKIFARHSTIVNDCIAFFEKSAKIAENAGIKRENILFDPGIGFGTDTNESLQLIRAIPFFQKEGYPQLIGASRKRFIGATLDGVPVEERDAGTLAVSLFCKQKKAAAVRVHNVHATVMGYKMQDALEAE